MVSVIRKKFSLQMIVNDIYGHTSTLCYMCRPKKGGTVRRLMTSLIQLLSYSINPKRTPKIVCIYGEKRICVKSSDRKD